MTRGRACRRPRCSAARRRARRGRGAPDRAPHSDAGGVQDAGGAVQSVSVGNVSENRAAVAAPDTSAAAQAAELYRRAGLYADIYRGC